MKGRSHSGLQEGGRELFRSQPFPGVRGPIAERHAADSGVLSTMSARDECVQEKDFVGNSRMSPSLFAWIAMWSVE